MLGFVAAKKFPRLYQGEVHRVSVTDGVATQERAIRPFMEVDQEDTQLDVGFEILDDSGERLGAWGTTYRVADVMSAYRTWLLLGLVKNVDRRTIARLIRSVLTGKYVNPELRQEVRTQIGTEFDRVSRTVPPELMDLLYVLKQHKVAIDVPSLVQEIRDGNLAHTTELEEQFQVERPEDIDAWEARKAARLAPYRTHVRAWLNSGGSSHEPECPCEQEIMRTVYHGVLRGIEDPAMVVGFAISCFALMRATIIAVADAVVTSTGVVSMGDVLRSVCEFLVQEFETGKDQPRTWEDFLKELTDVRHRWDDMKETVKI